MTVKEEEITFFSVDLNPSDGYFLSYICSKCILRMKKILPKAKFKIYTPNDEIVKEALEYFKDYIDFIEKDVISYDPNCSWAHALKTDCIRMYILSKLKYHLYFDTDVYIIEDNVLKENLTEEAFSYCGCYSTLWNGSELYKFKNLVDYYKDPNGVRKLDCIIDSDVLASKDFNLKQVYFKQVHYSENSMFYCYNDLIIVMNCDDEKNKFFTDSKICNKVIFVKKEHDGNGTLHHIYWSYIFDTYEDYKKYCLEHKPEGTIKFV